MDYQGMVIRPPSEALSIILQVTLGCSHNACAFCGTYRDKPFARKDWAQIEADIAFVGQYCKRQNTLFLADGDVLALPREDLVRILMRIREAAPWVRRVSCYASSRNIAARTDEELSEYRALGLRRLHLGLESGHDPTLLAIHKGATAADMIEAARRVHAAGMTLSVSCILGLAGAERSRDHALATAEVLNQMRPDHVGLLTLMLLDNTPLFREARAGRFVMPDRRGLLEELRALLSRLETRCAFAANHPSNHLVLSGRLPRDKETLLARVDAALRGEIPLREEAERGL